MQQTPGLTKFLKWSAKMAAKPISFVLGLVFVAVWVLIGLIWGFSETWMLIINTIATINAALMVFIIQNTQNRESKALHLKIDELLLSIKDAKNELIAIEEVEEEELEILKKKLHQRRIQQEKGSTDHPA